jgi:hypothetical protein
MPVSYCPILGRDLARFVFERGLTPRDLYPIAWPKYKGVQGVVMRIRVTEPDKGPFNFLIMPWSMYTMVLLDESPGLQGVDWNDGEQLMSRIHEIEGENRATAEQRYKNYYKRPPLTISNAWPQLWEMVQEYLDLQLKDHRQRRFMRRVAKEVKDMRKDSSH